LPVQPFCAQTVVTVRTEHYGDVAFILVLLGFPLRSVIFQAYERTLKKSGVVQVQLPIVQPVLLERFPGRVGDDAFNQFFRHPAQALCFQRAQPHARAAVHVDTQCCPGFISVDGGLGIHLRQIKIPSAHGVQQVLFGV